jgi:hypothetical protein
MRNALLGFTLCAAIVFCASCGSREDCTITPIQVTVSPAAATADHAAVSPGNQVQFTASISGGHLSSSNCSIPLVITGPVWSSFDETVAQVDQNGLATCLQASTTPVRIQASAVNGMVNGSSSAELTCH